MGLAWKEPNLREMTCFPLVKSPQNRTGHPQANRHTPVLLTCETSRTVAIPPDDCRVVEDDYSSGEQRKIRSKRSNRPNVASWSAHAA